MLKKLNIGCGFDKRAGYINVDAEKACEPDVVADLEKKWPFEDNSIEEVRACHILEHLGAETKVFIGIMQEMYRVCVDGAKILIQVPHHNHWTFHADPTHVRKILPEGLRLFDQEHNLSTIAGGHADTCLGIYAGVDFALEKADPTFDEPWGSRMRNGVVTNHDLQFAGHHYSNAILQWDIVLRVRKPSASAVASASGSELASKMKATQPGARDLPG